MTLKMNNKKRKKKKEVCKIHLLNNKRNKIVELSDSDFLSFLYSEREREHNISQYQGWNNWVLAGTIIGALISGYTIIKDNLYSLDYLQITYYVSGLWAFFLGFKFLILFFLPLRGVDYSKVRTLKSTTPWVNIVFVLSSSLLFVAILILFGKKDIIVLLWGILFIIYILEVFLTLFFRNRIVSVFYDNLIFPFPQIDNFVEAIKNGIFAAIFIQSFYIASWHFFNISFEIGACFTFIFILFYVLFKINNNNKAVKRFDKIVDEHIYNGDSKEKTFEKICINRMEYNSFYVCCKEMKDIASDIQTFVNEIQELSDTLETFDIGTYPLQNMYKHLSIVKRRIRQIKKLSKKNGTISNKIVQINEKSPLIANTQEYEQVVTIYKNNCVLIDNLEQTLLSIRKILASFKKQYHCRKCGRICFKACEMRNERFSLVYWVKIRCQCLRNKIKLYK